MLKDESRKFLEFMACEGIGAVELGRVAQNQGASEQVRELGARIMHEAIQINHALKALGDQLGVSLPQQVNPDQQKRMLALSAQNGAAFDRQYLDDEVGRLRRVIERVERMAGDHTATGNENQAVERFAAQWLDLLKQAQQQVQAARNRLQSAGQPRA